MPQHPTPTLHERLLNWGRERPLVQFQAVRLLVTTPWLDDPDFVAACLTGVDARLAAGR